MNQKGHDVGCGFTGEIRDAQERVLTNRRAPLNGQKTSGSIRVRAVKERIGCGSAHELRTRALEEEPAVRHDTQNSRNAIDLPQAVGGDHDRDSAGRQ